MWGGVQYSAQRTHFKDRYALKFRSLPFMALKHGGILLGLKELHVARREQDERLKHTRTSSPERQKGVWVWKPQSRYSFEPLHCSNHSSRFWIYAVSFILYTEKTKAKSPALRRQRTDAAPLGPGDPSRNLFSLGFLHIVFVDLKEKCEWTSQKGNI